MKIKFIIAYDGSAYFGWQRQNSQRSVQGTIEEALQQIFQQEVLITGAGRTDRGVHAKRQVATARLPKEVSLYKLEKSLNSLLPEDISIYEIEEAEERFHNCFSAKGKFNRYSISTQKTLNPFTRHHHFHYPYPLNMELLEAAIPLFVGTKDFSAFAKQIEKEGSPNPIKTIYSITLDRTNEGFTLTFHGSGFLYKMVRNITGAVINIGAERITLAELEQILLSKKNTHNLLQAPARGLSLEQVLY